MTALHRVISVLFLLTSLLSAQEPDNSEQSRRAIVATAEAFSAAYMRGDVDAMMACYTDDAVIMPGGTDIIRGAEALRRYWTLPPGRVVTHHRSESEELIIVGNTAYDYGYYEGATARDGGEPAPFRGKYVIVWEKGADGAWRMKVDMWNTRAKPDESEER